MIRRPPSTTRSDTLLSYTRLFRSLDWPRLQALGAGLGAHDAQATLLAQALVEQPPVLARDGGVFADDHDAELAELRRLSTTADQFLVDLEQREREATGIEIGRASCRERGCQYEKSSGVAVSLKKKKNYHANYNKTK